MKSKVKFLNKEAAQKWYVVTNLFIKSKYPFSDALRQFNQLTQDERITIRKRFSECDEIRRQQISKDDSALEEAWTVNVMVDAHIIATEMGIDPLAAALCISAPCKPHEKIVMR